MKFQFRFKDFLFLFNKKVLAESEQIRREADNIGPRAELDYWKKRMTKFNFLLDQIKGQDVKAVLTILQTAKSKLISVKISKKKNYFKYCFFFS
jgi:Dynein heavy chain, N-terminal region 1